MAKYFIGWTNQEVRDWLDEQMPKASAREKARIFKELCEYAPGDYLRDKLFECLEESLEDVREQRKAELDASRPRRSLPAASRSVNARIPGGHRCQTRKKI